MISTNAPRQAITTKYFGPTNHRGSRVKASADAGSISVPWDHALNAQQNHTAAAQALIHQLGWGGRWVVGGTRSGYVFVDVSHD